jgi:lipopolysaccharide transport system ATP-binding protein
MSQPIIEVKGISKRYQLGAIGATRLRDDVERLWHHVTGKSDVIDEEDFWALRDVSFEVRPGEIVGIIGRNGAGKSTLLKILSRITEPSNGEIVLRGRVASLLEVGTGFVGDLSGRDNIFLNGAILGMSKAEIRSKFDEIVAFSEIEKFIDTPVKRYSSGMYVRLAFAVAAHLEPEILIIDEVLAVGDAEFQTKCLGKMQEVSEGQGRTVLFVSHNMNAVESLCQRVVHLEQGRVLEVSGDVRAAIASYLAGPSKVHGPDWRNPGDALPNPFFHPLRFYVGDEHGNVANMPVRNDTPVFVWIEGEIKESDLALNVGYALYDDAGLLLYWSAQTDVAQREWPKLIPGRNVLKSQIPCRLLNQGEYRLELIIALYHRSWISAPGSNAPAVELSIHGGLSDSPYWMERRPGVLGPVCPWVLSNNKETDEQTMNVHNYSEAHASQA